MLNPVDLIWGLFREVKLRYRKWETNSLPLQALKLILEALKEKRLR